MSKKAICLISDGLDSPVATFLLENQGIEVIGLNFDNNPFVIPVTKNSSNNSEKNMKLENNDKQILNIAQRLVKKFKKQKLFSLYQLPHGEDLGNIIKDSDDVKLTCVLCKRLMLKKAQYIAKKINADFIATGDILGEQASQTIENLQIIQEALGDIVLVRPNIGLNKEEVINIARKIGTYQYSEIAAKYACSAVPNKPSTKADLNRIKKAEKKLEIEKMVEKSYKQAKKYSFKK